MAFITRAVLWIIHLLARIASVIAPPLLRVALAAPFLKSGLTKWTGFLSLSPTATFLFEHIYKLHFFGQLDSFPAPAVFAWLDGVGEIVLPALLIVGLATRFSALGLLVMTLVIWFVVPGGWSNFNLPWAGLAVAIVCLGPGALSLDYLIGQWFARVLRYQH